jgi:hypothetical protein
VVQLKKNRKDFYPILIKYMNSNYISAASIIKGELEQVTIKQIKAKVSLEEFYKKVQELKSLCFFFQNTGFFVSIFLSPVGYFDILRRFSHLAGIPLLDILYHALYPAAS